MNELLIFKNVNEYCTCISKEDIDTAMLKYVCRVRLSIAYSKAATKGQIFIFRIKWVKKAISNQLVRACNSFSHKK